MKRLWKAHLPAVLATCLAMPAAEKAANDAPRTFRQYCVQCHGAKTPMAGVSLDKLTSQPSVGDNFQQWLKVAAVLEDNRMPPKGMPQPTKAERGHAVAWIRAELNDYTQKHAGDPGRVTVRRLTSAEYGYTIQDLTGLELDVDRDFASDSVGGEGFTNFGDVQFMEDANLERYLDAAKTVARHAVIGSGPIEFFADPGKSGLELSAVSRIQEIYNTHGFRAAAGEGGKPYGMDRYAKAFYASWRYQHRKALGEPDATMEQVAAREGISTRFLQHIWSVLQDPSPSYPTSEIVALWRKLPAPGGRAGDAVTASVRAGCEEAQKFLIHWPRWLFAAGELAAGGAGDERALIVTEESLEAGRTHRFRFPMRRTRGQKTATAHFTLVGLNPYSKDKPFVIWRNASVRFRQRDKAAGPPQPLQELLDEATVKKLAFGTRPDGGPMGPRDFAMAGDTALVIEIPTKEDAGGLELQVEAEVIPGASGDAVLRCTISESEDLSKGRPVWALLADPQTAGFQAWKKDVLEFAANLPQVSHGEPTPSDKDPIPAPFNNVYNQPERDHFHVKLKYYRTDGFLVEKMLDDATRVRLDQAWTDLLTSFEYHNAFLRFVAEKYKLDLKGKRIADLDGAFLDALSAEPRAYIQALRAEFLAMTAARNAAQAGHVEDCIRFAGRAWRRPLTDSEKQSLRSFYQETRKDPELDHAKAIRAVLARILVSPAFLYRLETAAEVSGVRRLSDWEMASRMSYFLWSSVPDGELRRAAAAGELSDEQQLRRQVKRMLADPKARRLSTEFFGQWLGFYRFDQYRGVDSTRFPEFTAEVKEAMYDEAVSFFEHIIRNNRPVREILSADYTFLNQALARHYGVEKEIAATKGVERVEGANGFQRGGLMRLGAVLTATSAPLRTSPVKRGDWVLRRVLGTPTPPPPADAGSIPADDKLFQGLTVRERLEAHQRNPSCASCHTRIDPLGFPLEHFDAVGRWRDQYSDGKPIHDSGALADQTVISGIDGLLQYLSDHEEQVLRTLSNKLIGYALGRTILASDLPLIDRLAASGGKAGFADLVTEIVASRQFRYRRHQEGGPAPVIAGGPTVKSSQKEGGR